MQKCTGASDHGATVARRAAVKVVGAQLVPQALSARPRYMSARVLEASAAERQLHA